MGTAREYLNTVLTLAKNLADLTDDTLEKAQGFIKDASDALADALNDEEQRVVTCDNCPATSEAGWGDTPLCLDCQRKDDPSKVCEEHQRTFEDDACPLDHCCPGTTARQSHLEVAGHGSAVTATGTTVHATTATSSATSKRCSTAC